MKWIIAFLSLWLGLASAWADGFAVPGVPQFGGKAAFSYPPTTVAPPTYQGPGDVAPSTALIWGSCARVYNASLASTSTNLCDLVAVSTPSAGAAVCTLRGSSTGLADLTSSYCNGTTPAAACSAAGGCLVSKVYDQIGGTSGWVNATNSQRPALTFSAANGLPGLTGTSAAGTNLTSSSTFTQATPFTWVSVAKRTANFTTQQGVIGSSGAYNGSISFDIVVNQVFVSGGAVKDTLGSVTDNALHSLQGVQDTTCVINADGTENLAACGAISLSANTSRIMRFAGGNSLDGLWMEGGLWAGGFSSGNRTLMNSNIHGANGYNF